MFFQLFDHIAACLSEFLDSQNLKGQTLPMGFTFSFPCEQKEIDKVFNLTLLKLVGLSLLTDEDCFH